MSQAAPGALSLVARGTCPPWCVTGHGVHLGEEDWVHVGEPLPMTDGVSAQLCMSIDPATGTQDGPYVLIGGTEYSLAEAATLASSLMSLVTRH